MSEKFRNKYTIKSTRLEKYNYSQNGMYFVTICTKDREEFFGKIENGKMILNDVGKIIKDEWLQAAIIRPNVILDEWIIMPNHLHGIIEIINQSNGVETPHGRDALQCVSTYKNKFGPQTNNLSSIIRGFKGMVTKRVHMCDLNFAWQSRFYDHVIRDEKSLNNIREYIQTNPKMWERDRNLPAGEAGNLGDVFM